MQGPGSRSAASSASKARMPEVPLTTGTSACGSAAPIIGPPMTSRAGVARRPAKASTSETSAPIGTRMLPGLATAPPLTVTMRCVSASPRRSARCTARAVPTLCTTTPMSDGRASAGTSRPVSIRISWRSEPIG